MSNKPDLQVIEGGAGGDSLIEEVPEQKEFTCPDCGRSCIIYPRHKPVAVVHAEPRRDCRSWRNIEDKKDDLERFLIKAGVHLLIGPKGEA